jgi:hypothetical protein
VAVALDDEDGVDDSREEVALLLKCHVRQ